MQDDIKYFVDETIPGEARALLAKQPEEFRIMARKGVRIQNHIEEWKLKRRSLRGRLFLKLRSGYIPPSMGHKSKLTEDEVSAIIDLDPRVLKIDTYLNACYAKQREIAVDVEALRQRYGGLRTLVDTDRAEEQTNSGI